MPLPRRDPGYHRGYLFVPNRLPSPDLLLDWQESEYVRFHLDKYNAFVEGLRDTVLISTVIQIGVRFVRVTFIGYARYRASLKTFWLVHRPVFLCTLPYILENRSLWSTKSSRMAVPN